MYTRFFDSGVCAAVFAHGYGKGGLVLRWNGRADGKGENILQEQGQKKGRGLGFQLNAITLTGIVVMVTILVRWLQSL